MLAGFLSPRIGGLVYQVCSSAARGRHIWMWRVLRRTGYAFQSCELSDHAILQYCKSANRKWFVFGFFGCMVEVRCAVIFALIQKNIIKIIARIFLLVSV